ncbi:MAG: pseudouridine synthase [Myxococcota bacterium]|nr:pseudouridine synthase [Myxococcota bacterium]
MTALPEADVARAAVHAAGVDAPVSCDHAERCGGCPLIGLSYAEQLDRKRVRVSQALAAYPALALVPTEPVAPADPRVGYRTRAKLIVGSAGGIGLFAKGGGHELVDIPGCRVLSPTLARVASTLRKLVAGAAQSGGALVPFDGSERGCLRGVDLREVIDGEGARALVTFVVQRARVSSMEPLERAARELMRNAPEVVGVACNFHEGDSPQALGSKTVPLAGTTSAPDRIGPSTHFATFGSFVQAHRGQAARVHAVLVEALGLAGTNVVRPRVLDLYGGSGAIGLGLAAAGASVRMIESFGPAVAQARSAAAAQRLDVDAVCADVPLALRDLAERRERFDAAIVNPPRRGMNPLAREWLARLAPRLIAYVSCDAQTFTRDLDHLARLGYATRSVNPVDMIPLTEEIESLAVLRPAPIALPTVRYVDAEILVVDKAPHEPTAVNGEYAGSLLDRVRRLPGAQQAVPVHGLDVGTSGLVTFARDPERAAAWKEILSSASSRRIYLAAVRGVTPAKGAVTRDLRQRGKVVEARTRYRRLAVATGHSILLVTPEQANTHQVRRHFAALGHPVLGDDRYGHPLTNRFFEEKNGLDRTFLHCVRLEFEEPGSGIRRVIESPLPGDLRAVLTRTSGAATLDFLDQKNALGLDHRSTRPPSALTPS